MRVSVITPCGLKVKGISDRTIFLFRYPLLYHKGWKPRIYISQNLFRKNFCLESDHAGSLHDEKMEQKGKPFLNPTTPRPLHCYRLVLATTLSHLNYRGSWYVSLLLLASMVYSQSNSQSDFNLKQIAFLFKKIKAFCLTKSNLKSSSSPEILSILWPDFLFYFSSSVPLSPQCPLVALLFQTLRKS